jgi:hypothetical protein
MDKDRALFSVAITNSVTVEYNTIDSNSLSKQTVEIKI